MIKKLVSNTTELKEVLKTQFEEEANPIVFSVELDGDKKPIFDSDNITLTAFDRTKSWDVIFDFNGNYKIEFKLWKETQEDGKTFLTQRYNHIEGASTSFLFKLVKLLTILRMESYEPDDVTDPIKILKKFHTDIFN